jgi:16S rRNA (uracil1498-N3)-methyltransferase
MTDDCRLPTEVYRRMVNNRVVLPRFFAPDLDPERGEVALPSEEARQLTRVLRLTRGDEVVVFDGRGWEFVARVETTGRDRVSVMLVRQIDPRPEPRVPIVLIQAILKGNKMDDVVRDAVMLGARAIVPLISAHVAVKGGAITHGRPAGRWRRIALSSAKQCGRTTVPDIHDPVPFRDWLSKTHETLFLVEPSAAPPGTVSLRSYFGRVPPESAALVVGPEGGWSPDEVASAVATGWTTVTLGRLTLRADAVAVAALSMLQVLWNDEHEP